MKKLITLTTSLVFLLVFVIPFLFALLIKMIPGGDQPSYDFNVKRAIYGDFDVTQEFTSTEGNLTAIATSIGNPNLKNQKEVVFKLKDISGSMIREVKINGMNIPDGSLFKFNFAPIQNSKDQKYIFTISSPAAGPEEVLYIFFSRGKTSWIGSAIYNKEVNENGLPIITYFKPQSHLKVVYDIYMSWLKRVVGFK